MQMLGMRNQAGQIITGVPVLVISTIHQPGRGATARQAQFTGKSSKQKEGLLW
jgi:hypothetical protein